MSAERDDFSNLCSSAIDNRCITRLGIRLSPQQICLKTLINEYLMGWVWEHPTVNWYDYLKKIIDFLIVDL